MPRRTASQCVEPRLHTAHDMTRFERATRDFYKLILTITAADVVAADRERLRVLLQDLHVLERKRSIS
jgi:hypothetical protein